MPNVALLTCQDLSGYVSDDSMLIPALNALDVSTQVIPWDQPTQWDQFDAAIVRTTWDYTDRFDEFWKVLAHIDSKTRLFNPFETMKWNGNKQYLFDLQRHGANIIPTLHWKPNSQFQKFKEDVAHWGLRLLVKPTIGATSRGVEVFEQTQLSEVLARRQDVLLQPFLEEILNGELSFIFTNGKFSHAVQKIPKSGDFRVQDEFGGRIIGYAPSDAEIRSATEVLKAANATDLLYARVDAVKVNSRLLVMELELIEPALYFRTAEGSAQRFAKSILERL